MIAYFNGNFLDHEDIRILPEDRGFLFADGLYEVIRAYHGKLFRAKDHIDRMNYGARHLRLSKTNFSEIEDIALALIQKNDLAAGEATVYIQVSRGAARRIHAFPDPPVGLTFYATASRMDPGPARQKQEQGIHAVTVPDIRWARCDMKTTGLTANVLANQTAVENGADEAVFVRDGVMLEGTKSNFMAVLDGALVTAPLSNYILGGVTRKCVLELCETEKIRVSHGPVFEKDIHLASELMIVGTISEITPIVRLNHESIRDGVPGPVTRRIQAAFARVIEAL
ncbi:MAG: aminotransferase class IV [Desulfobacula sp.]|nr:aminotransferase class IV [Desulfobacula sp.]